jgi:tetratricopeptide (TPR) repeat protein
MKTAFALAFSASAIVLAAAAPAAAQRAAQAMQPKQKAQVAQPSATAPQRKFNISKGAQKPLTELQAAVTANDTANLPARLAAAEAVAKNPDERYFVAQMRLNMAIAAKDRGAQRTAIDAILRSGGALPEELPKFYRALAGLAYEAKDYDGAIAAYGKVLELQPGDRDVTNNLIILHRDRKAYPQALALVQQSITASKAAGEPVPENLYLIGLQTAIDGNLRPQMLSLTRDLLSTYPNPKNWANGLNVYRQTVDTDDEAMLDTFRLMRATKSLTRSNEYIALADTLARGRYYAEARNVLNEGIAAGKLTASNASAAAILKEVSGRIAGDKTALAGLEGRARSEATGAFALKIAEGYYGHGDFAKAADFYRLALQKGSVDTNLVNNRLGMALAQSGRKAEAEAALKAVSGKRADLAGLWLLWLNRQA